MRIYIVTLYWTNFGFEAVVVSDTPQNAMGVAEAFLTSQGIDLTDRPTFNVVDAGDASHLEGVPGLEGKMLPTNEWN
jgi:hypothetical protein